MRLLGITRLSDFRDESLSVEQQQQMMTDYAKLHGHTITDFADDTDISGDFGPFHPRRSISDWLNNRQSEYDGIIFRAINRVARNAEQTLRLIRWAEHRNKMLISIKDGIDTSTDAGRTMAKFMAVVAEMELDQIKSRAKDAYIYKTRTARQWAGMQVPFGYMPQKEGNGYKLIHDPTYAPILSQMVERFLNGASFGEIARWLNQTGIPSSRNVERIRNGKQPTNTKWTTDSVSKVLKSPAMLGAIVTSEVLERDDETNKPTRRSDPKPLYDDDGNFILRAEPIVSYGKWAEVQARISSNPQVGKPHINASPLLKIAYCGISGDQMYMTRTTYPGGKVNRYYVCAKSSARSRNGTDRCSSKRFSAEWLEQVIQDEVIASIGYMPYLIPHITPRQEYSDQLRQVNDAIVNLLELAESGAFKGRTEVFQERMDKLEAHKAELESKPSSPEKKTWLPTDKTIGEHFFSLSPDDRWQFLRDMNVRAYISRGQLPHAEYNKPSGSANPMNIPQFTMTSDANGEEWTDKTIHVTIALGTLREMTEAYNERASNLAKS